MLQELKVSQFAIIDHLHIEFQSGLNILSGETGSGKSILLKSLALLMGEKASSDIIRTGAQQAVVEGSFDLRQRPDIEAYLNESGIETPDHTLIVKRIIAQADKSKVYLNGSLSTLNQLKDTVFPMIEVTGHNAPLIEMTGQHDNRHLLSKSYHLDLLDQYAGHYDKRTQYESKFSQLTELRQQINEFEAQAQQKSQRLDFLKFQYEELNKVGIDPLQDAQLEEEIKTLKSAHKILNFIEECEQTLFGDDDSVSARLKSVQKRAGEFTSLNQKFAEHMETLAQAQNLIDDAVYSLRKDFSSLQIDADAMEEKEQRLSQIRKLQKKYGADLAEIAQAQIKIKAEIDRLENSDAHLDQIKKQAAQFELELKKMAEELHKTRLKFADKLTEAVNKELADLNMKGVRFAIGANKLDNLSATGLSEIEYLCRISENDPNRPIAKVASGGELSRILLALKKSLGQSDKPRTYLFDEVDTGVSGNTAEKVGRKLKAIAQGQQVICVTHLPQVASFGDAHFSIQKATSAKSVQMLVTELKSKERINEIARLISGEKITKTSLAHAEQLLSESRG